MQRVKFFENYTVKAEEVFKNPMFIKKTLKRF